MLTAKNDRPAEAYGDIEGLSAVSAAAWQATIDAADADTLDAPDWLEQAYARGVPMGGTLTPSRAQDRPKFIVLSAKDPIGANLDRLQVIKAWTDSEGDTHEKIFDIAGVDAPEPTTIQERAVSSAIWYDASE